MWFRKISIIQGFYILYDSTVNKFFLSYKGFTEFTMHEFFVCLFLYDMKFICEWNQSIAKNFAVIVKE
jgi:hypothetical protein